VISLYCFDKRDKTYGYPVLASDKRGKNPIGGRAKIEF
jgi:hypothetical protein